MGNSHLENHMWNTHQRYSEHWMALGCWHLTSPSGSITTWGTVAEDLNPHYQWHYMWLLISSLHPLAPSSASVSLQSRLPISPSFIPDSYFFSNPISHSLRSPSVSSHHPVPGPCQFCLNPTRCQCNAYQIPNDSRLPVLPVRVHRKKSKKQKGQSIGNINAQLPTAVQLISGKYDLRPKKPGSISIHNSHNKEYLSAMN